MLRLHFILLLIFPIALFGQMSYHTDIEPIIKKHCIACHSNGEIGPMPLASYTEVASYASMIKFVTSTKLMPPFKADHHKVDYKNERSISKEEIATIEAWIADGLLEGNPTIPSPMYEAEAIEYDKVICMEEAFEHYGIYYDQYQAFVLPAISEENRFISRIDVMPGNKKIVRSAYLSLSAKGDADAMDIWDPRYGFYAYGSLGFEPSLPNWHSWMPNTSGLGINENEINLLPANSELILHIHYGPYGEIELDSTCVGLVYDDGHDKVQLQNIPMLATEYIADSFLLEAELSKRFSSSFYIPEDTYLKSVTPLAHLLCKNWEVFAVLPDRSTLPLLSISDWDFHWRERYVFKDYIFLPKGTRIVGTATYNNTSQNPYNPSDPPHTMDHGPHMFDENYLCYFEFLNTNENPTVTIQKPFTVAKSQIQELVFTCHQEANYKITLHNLSDKTSYSISKKAYPVGEHIIVSSSLPHEIGRYAISISSGNEHQDIWYFVIK